MTEPAEGDEEASVAVTASDAAVRLTVVGSDDETVVTLEPADALGLANDVLEATRASRRGGTESPSGDERTDGGSEPPSGAEDDTAEFTRGGSTGGGDADRGSGVREFTRGGSSETAERGDHGGLDVLITCHECGFSWSHSGGGRWTECPACGTSTRVGRS